MKRIISVVLAIMMLITAFSMPTLAADGDFRINVNPAGANDAEKLTKTIEFDSSNPGTFDVDFMLEKTGVNNMEFWVEYNPDVIKAKRIVYNSTTITYYNNDAEASIPIAINTSDTNINTLMTSDVAGYEHIKGSVLAKDTGKIKVAWVHPTAHITNSTGRLFTLQFDVIGEGTTGVIVSAVGAATSPFMGLASTTIPVTIYKGNVIVAGPPSSDASLSDLTVSGVTVTNFDTTTLLYNVILPPETTTPPSIVATATDSNANVVVTNATTLPGDTVIVVTAEDGITTRTYRVKFTLAADTTPPVITLLGSATVNLSIGDTYTDAGATAFDNVDGNITSEIVTTITNNVDAGTTFDSNKAATYTYHYNVKDTAGNSATMVTRTVIVSPVSVTGVTLNKSSLNLTVGDSEKLIATVNPANATNKNITWTSSDLTVATVSGGTLTPLKAGTTTITVKTNDGNYTATAQLTVTNANQNAPTGLTGVAPTSLSNNDGKITGTTSLMEYKLSTDSTWVSVTGAQITGLAAGTYNVRYKAKTGYNAGTPTDVVVAAYVKSSDATLSNLTVNGTTVTGFNKNILTYNVQLPAGTVAIPTVAATRSDSKANLVVTQTPSVTGQASAKVTAEDGATKTYTINFTVAPNEDQNAPTGLTGVAPTSSSTNDGKITGTTSLMEYKLSTDTTWVSVTGTEITGLAAGTYNVRYKAKTGYNAGATANVVVAAYIKSSDATLSDLKVNGTTVTGFNKDTLTYNVQLPAGTVAIPTVAATRSDSKASLVVIQAPSVTGQATAEVTAENGSIKTYKINFTVTPNEDQNAPTGLTGVAPTSLSNNDGKITGTTSLMEYKLSTDSTWVSITNSQITGLAAGTYNVRYKAKTGYNAGATANVVVAAYIKSSDATLSDLTVNGTTVTGFDKATLTYDVILPIGTIDVPTIAGTITDSKASLAVTQSLDVTGQASAKVTAEDGTIKTYTINFTLAVDTTAPVITLKGDATVNLKNGERYTDAGATASDDVDGDITSDIVVAGDIVDAFVAGTYTITYDVTDAAGNKATQVTRTVIVAEALSDDATISSTIGKVDNDAGTIFNIPHGTTLADFKAAITLTGGAGFEVFEADGITPAKDLTSTYKLIIMADTGATMKTYTISVLAAEGDKDNSESPQTGSSSLIFLYLSIGLAILIGIVFKKKKGYLKSN